MSKKLTILEILERFKNVHGDRYDYSLVEYLSMKTNVIIICPDHGQFLRQPADHISKKSGCPECSKNFKDTTKSFIKKANIIHDFKYDYSLVNYINTYKIVEIICTNHKSPYKFLQSPNNHINLKNGCPECKKNNLNNLNKNKNILKNFKDIHGDKYDYSKVNYINNKTKVIIICKEHGEFPQAPSRHFNNKQGCPVCMSSKGELQIRKLLEENGIRFTQQKKYDDCKNIRSLPFDFYLDEYNILIEYDGIQHYEPVDIFGGNQAFKKCQINDKIKNEFCLENGIELLRIKYDDNIAELLTKKIKQIKKLDNK